MDSGSGESTKNDDLHYVSEDDRLECAKEMQQSWLLWLLLLILFAIFRWLFTQKTSAQWLSTPYFISEIK